MGPGMGSRSFARAVFHQSTCVSEVLTQSATVAKGRRLVHQPYYLTVHDLVSFARSRGILCQGRGSVANSAVCYCLGITSLDLSHQLGRLNDGGTGRLEPSGAARSTK